jgi:uroporphyrinogen III methyltransferase/synthase
MQWFENRPLMGKRIVVTRAREQASELVKVLSDLGAECLECPTIKIVPPDDWKPLDIAIEHLSLYDWLIFTSVNSVNFFFERLFKQNRDVRALSNLRTASIGPATAKRMFNFGLKSDIVPKSYMAESVIEAFAQEDIKGKRILLPRAKEARPILPVELAKMGAEVNEVTAYCTKEVCDNVDILMTGLEQGTIDLITFTSSSTVKNFHALIPSAKFNDLMKGLTIAAIGPITADTAKELGIDVHIVAESFTIPGLCEAIKQFYNN